MSAHASVGDRGQRYEIRITGYGPNAPGESVLGWSDTLDGAHRMLNAILKAPRCTSAMIFDRENNEKVITRFAGVLR